MAKLYLLLGSCTALAYLYDHTYVTTLQGPRKSRLIYFVLMALLICFGGFRGQYNDTWTYRDAYVYLTYPFPEAWDTIPWELGGSPFFWIVNSFLKTYNVEVHLFLFFYFFWTTVLFMNFFKRYADGFALTIFLFIATGCYQFNMAAMKQVMATAICLAAMPLVEKKTWSSILQFLLLIGVASLFHPYAFMYLTALFFDKKPWSKFTYLLIIVIVVGGVLFQPLVGTVVDITTAIGKNYNEEVLTQEGVSIIRIIVVLVPVVLSFIYRKVLFEDCSPHECIFMHMTILFAGILFAGRFGTALYFGRLSYYFCAMPVVVLPWMLKKISRYNPRDGAFLTICAVIGYTAFLYFSNTLETDFNTSYAAITPSQFLKYLFSWLGELLT